MARYGFVSEHRALWSVEEMCRVLEVSRSGFYAWQQRPISARGQETQRLDTEIKELFEASRQRSGSPKITRALGARGWHVSKNRVADRMRHLGLRSIVRRRFRVTTNSKHRFPGPRLDLLRATKASPAQWEVRIRGIGQATT